MAESIQRNGVWYNQRSDGSWLRYNDATKQWEPAPSGPPPEGGAAPSPQAPAQQPQPGYAAQPGPGGQPPGGYAPPQQYPPPQGYAGQPPAGGQAYGGVAPGTPLSPQGRPLAHWWKRVVASLIDGVILTIPSYILTAIFGVGLASSVSVNETTGEVTGGTGFFVGILVSSLILFAIGIAYVVYFNGSERGQTPGKMILKIQVRDQVTGGPIGYGKAAIRWIVSLVLFMVCYIPGIVDLLFPLWDDKRQTLHDKAANSLVIDLAP
jgi:uncharacterized RDD family membrane protein YckC